MSERIAYEELQPGDVIQPGDEWQNDDGRWHPLVLMAGACTQVRDGLRARRPHNITALQNERDELQTALRESRAAHQVTMGQGLAACKERDEANAQIQRLLKTIAENADQFAEHTKWVVHERDEARAECDRLQEVVGNLYNEPTARQAQDMLRTWATELDWSGCCFDSTGRDKVSAVQRVLIAVMERIEGMINPEGGTDDN